MRSAHWHIELEPWVMAHPLLQQDVWDKVKAIPGIRQINDMEVISPQTYEEWMLPREQSLVQPKRNRRGK